MCNSIEYGEAANQAGLSWLFRRVSTLASERLFFFPFFSFLFSFLFWPTQEEEEEEENNNKK